MINYRKLAVFHHLATRTQLLHISFCFLFILRFCNPDGVWIWLVPLISMRKKEEYYVQLSVGHDPAIIVCQGTDALNFERLPVQPITEYIHYISTGRLSETKTIKMLVKFNILWPGYWKVTSAILSYSQKWMTKWIY